MYLWTRKQVSLWTHLENRLRLDSIKIISRSTAGNKVEAMLLIGFSDSKCNCPFSISIESYFFFSVLLAEHCHIHGELLWQEDSAAGRRCGCNIPKDVLESRFALRVILPSVWSRHDVTDIFLWHPLVTDLIANLPHCIVYGTGVWSWFHTWSSLQKRGWATGTLSRSELGS